MKLESLFQYLDDYLDVPGFPDYPNALNGLQVEGPQEVTKICVAVDASLSIIEAACAAEADLLLVHHGLFWDGLVPLRGPMYRKVLALLRRPLGLYSVHLPLDAHPEVGNCAILAREVGIEPLGRFGAYQGVDIGWWGEDEVDRDELARRIEEVVKGPVRLIAGGPETVRKAGVVTGGGSGHITEAAEAGLDALITGEGSHHSYIAAMEWGINLYLAGHYGTEVWGVQALASHLEERFGIAWEFLDFPTGM